MTPPLPDPYLIIAVDSRQHIGLYAHAVLKPNVREALQAVAVASITIQQIGTTRTASRQQVLKRSREFIQSGSAPG